MLVSIREGKELAAARLGWLMGREGREKTKEGEGGGSWAGSGQGKKRGREKRLVQRLGFGPRGTWGRR